MTRFEMDGLRVGDRVRVKTYNTGIGDFEWVWTRVGHVYTTTDGSAFAHGGMHSVWAEVNGFMTVLDNDLTERA